MKVSWVTSLLLFLVVTKAFGSSPHSMICPGYAHDVQFMVTGQVILARTLLGKENSEKIKTAIKAQLQFTNHLPLAHEGKWLKYFSASVNPDPMIKILSQEDVSYPFNLTLDGKIEDLYGAKSPYIVAGMKKGILGGRDKAILVKYESVISGALCTTVEKWDSSFDIMLPMDPYLAYWMVPPVKRIERSWGAARGRIPPCLNDEFTDIPVPNFTWYFWQPSNAACRTSEEAKKFVYKARVTVTSKQPFIDEEMDIFSSDGKKVSVIFGWINTQKEISTEFSTVKAWVSDWSRGKYSLFQGKDHSSKSLFSFLFGLPDSWKIRSIQDFGDHLKILLVDGTGRSIDIFWGPSDSLGKVPAKHWDFLTDALQNSDFIIYGGHAGLGENLKWQDQQKTKRSSIKKSQTLAILSCYSNSYFSIEKIFPRGGRKVGSRTLIQSVNEIKQVGKVSLALVKRFFGMKLTKNLKKEVGNDFLILEVSK